VIPARRRKAKAEMQRKMSDLRARLAGALRSEFERAQESSMARIQQAVDPYSRFVRAEETRWSETRATLTALGDKTSSFRDRLAA
jgi:hypothetical protein